MDRRRFVMRAAQLAASAALSPAALRHASASEPDGTKGAAGRSRRAITRAAEAFRRRVEAARSERDAEWKEQPLNGDRELGPWAIYAKGLPHNTHGEPDAAACHILADGLATGSQERLEAVPLGGYVKLADPQAAFAFDLIGPDAEQLVIPPPPSFSSEEQAAEMVELYWQALLRDVPFDDYDTHPLVARAAGELSKLPGYRGPRRNGQVTPRTIFRGGTRGGLVGPYISQFLWRDLPWTPIRVVQKIRTAQPQRDYLTEGEKWLAVQNGAIVEDTQFSEKPTYIRTPRDVTEYVHRDFTYQAFLGACLMLFKMSAPLDGGIPYGYSISQAGFVTFGPADIIHVVGLVANVALKSAWYQKWRCHMRIRPEEYGGRVAMQMAGKAKYPLHVDLLNSTALELTRARQKSGFLSQTYPEGAPLHPSYPAGHAVIAGACATVLKAFFAEKFVIQKPAVPAADGQSLVPWTGIDLTVGNELDKLAENIAIGRHFAGVHWPSDGRAGLRLGEEVAVAVLREVRLTSHEIVSGLNLTLFDGRRITI